MSGSPAPSGSEPTIRGRGGFRGGDLNTIPTNLVDAPLKATKDAVGKAVRIQTNFLRAKQIENRLVYSYRVDFEPEIESVRLKTRLLRKSAVLGTKREDLIFDEGFEARSGVKTEQEVTEVEVAEDEATYKLTIKRTGSIVPNSCEMYRYYNMNMKSILRTLGFFQVQPGCFVHPELTSKIGDLDSIIARRGYRTASALHDAGDIMMKFEPCHKITQTRNVMSYMRHIMDISSKNRETVKTLLIGKLVIAQYNNIVYRVEDVLFDSTPKTRFHHRGTNTEMSLIEYLKDLKKHNVEITDEGQPLLLVTQNNRRRQVEGQGEEVNEIKLIPELCHMAGLTEDQRNDNSLRNDLIRASQYSPAERVQQMDEFLNKLLNSSEVQRRLEHWGQKYENQPVKLVGRLMPIESVGAGRYAGGDPKQWPKANPCTGGFDNHVKSVAKVPDLTWLAVIASPELPKQRVMTIYDRLITALEHIGLKPKNEPKKIILPTDVSFQYVKALKELPPTTTAAIIILPRQNKERYDAIKKLATNERGLITQVVTASVTDNPKNIARGISACAKIAIQIAAKIGGEPWYISIPISTDMICGYDTYHDTANRGRSYGAFLASTNEKFSRWFSKADSHDRLDELSSHMSVNLVAALKRYKELNNKFPRCVHIYRDGVGDGQLEHVHQVELKQVLNAINEVDKDIKLNFTVVNKKTGAQFYMRESSTFINPTPGTAIDHTDTRQGRYDFYLISQSTGRGTVLPTYYNIIHDESGLKPEQHQMLAYKLCFLYYNWTGTVKVPAPCQYAHKLAKLCGEHLHSLPSAILDDKLHFL